MSKSNLSNNISRKITEKMFVLVEKYKTGYEILSDPNDIAWQSKNYKDIVEMRQSIGLSNIKIAKLSIYNL